MIYNYEEIIIEINKIIEILFTFLFLNSILIKK